MEPLLPQRSFRLRGRHLGVAVPVLVISGLALCVVAGGFLIEPPSGDIPGIALESEAILAVERAAALFAAWLLTLVVVIRALVGELPIEISGRGVRYADIGTSQNGLVNSEWAFKRVDHELEALNEAVIALDLKQKEQGKALSGYAVKDGPDGH